VKYVLDTNACIAHLRGLGKVTERLRALVPSEVAGVLASEHARVHLHRRRDAAQRGGSLSTSVDQLAAEPSSSPFRSPRSLGRL
jgi:predicted nucleic acid-binding protein